VKLNLNQKNEEFVSGFVTTPNSEIAEMMIKKHVLIYCSNYIYVTEIRDNKSLLINGSDDNLKRFEDILEKNEMIRNKIGEIEMNLNKKLLFIKFLNYTSC
jgi:hypothetical protein